MNGAHDPDPARPTTEFGTRLQRFWAGLAPEEKRAIGRSPAARLLAEGGVVGDWTVGGFIGRGGSAEVYCAHHRTLQKTAVLKVLHRTEASQKERFRREARFLMGVPGPSFPAIFGVGELPGGRPWMALELLEEYPLPSKDADVARYLLEVAAGVAVLHARGYVHRDLKPANILRREAGGHAVLIDFGLIKSIDEYPVPVADGLSVADDGRAVGAGTPGYAAPELFGGGEATPVVDVYALGMIADRCFGGHPPRAWTRIVAKATQSLPRLRYPGMEEFMRAVRHRHRPARLAVAAVVAAAVLTASLAFFVSGKSSPPPGARDTSGKTMFQPAPTVRRTPSPETQERVAVLSARVAESALKRIDAIQGHRQTDGRAPDEAIQDAFVTPPSDIIPLPNMEATKQLADPAFWLMNSVLDRLRHRDWEGIVTDVNQALSKAPLEKTNSQVFLVAAWVLLTNPGEDHCDPARAKRLYLQACGGKSGAPAFEKAIQAALQFAEGDIQGALETLKDESMPSESEPSTYLFHMTQTHYPSDLQRAYASGRRYSLPHF